MDDYPDPAPSVAADGVPHCTYDECPLYDGKRCRGTGSRPSGVCEPAVADMASLIKRLQGDTR